MLQWLVVTFYILFWNRDIAPGTSIHVMIKVWKKKQTKLLKYKPLGQAEIGQADADIILSIKMCLHCLEVLYLSWI